MSYLQESKIGVHKSPKEQTFALLCHAMPFDQRSIQYVLLHQTTSVQLVKVPAYIPFQPKVAVYKKHFCVRHLTQEVAHLGIGIRT